MEHQGQLLESPDQNYNNHRKPNRWCNSIGMEWDLLAAPAQDQALEPVTRKINSMDRQPCLLSELQSQEDSLARGLPQLVIQPDKDRFDMVLKTRSNTAGHLVGARPKINKLMRKLVIYLKAIRLLIVQRMPKGWPQVPRIKTTCIRQTNRLRPTWLMQDVTSTSKIFEEKVESPSLGYRWYISMHHLYDNK